MIIPARELKQEQVQENLQRDVSWDWDSDEELSPSKRQRVESVLPVGFLDPLTPEERLALQRPLLITPEQIRNANGSGVIHQQASDHDKPSAAVAVAVAVGKEKAYSSCKQFWKAGDYEVTDAGCSNAAGLMDHVRVHPKFLHSNATSHKWALGAFAELLDNALDEVCYGATYVNVDVLINQKDGSKMLLVEDNGGGMTPDKMRQCMSLGYSVKSKMANTIGQYGNGFKTSTMRLGADVIVFSRSQAKNGESAATQSIGMLSYSFLRDTGKEDIVVPMIHFKKEQGEDLWNKQMMSPSSYEYNLESIEQWSPYESEDHLLQQFNPMEDHGTRIIIYNLWEDDLGTPELDFETDQYDIQIKGFGPDEKKIDDAKKYPNSEHFLTYRHSLRSYAAILYRRIPPNYQMILRGKVIKHHDIVEDLMLTENLTYKPNLKDTTDTVATEIKIGFVKDARHHIDVQGFNVYHKNRLIKPFWRVWNAAGSDGRGVIGVLEANFVEPAHDKQGFERTAVLSRLEQRLIYLQKKYWTSNCHLIGYSQRRGPKKSVNPEKTVAPPSANKDSNPSTSTNGNITPLKRGASIDIRQPAATASAKVTGTGQFQAQARSNVRSSPPIENRNPEAQSRSNVRSSPPVENRNPAVSYSDLHQTLAAPVPLKTGEISGSVSAPSCTSVTAMAIKLYEENEFLRKSLKDVLQELQCQRKRNVSLENEVKDMKKKMDRLDEDQEAFVIAFTDERSRREKQEESLRQELKEKSDTIQNLLNKFRNHNRH